jgi:hypothetical protein
MPCVPEASGEKKGCREEWARETIMMIIGLIQAEEARAWGWGGGGAALFKKLGFIKKSAAIARDQDCDDAKSQD